MPPKLSKRDGGAGGAGSTAGSGREGGVIAHTPAASGASKRVLQGNDDQGNWIESHEALIAMQDENAQDWYAANAEWWAAGGYGGLTDEEAMIGDELGEADAEEGMRFLKDTMREFPSFRPRNAVDAGAGVGRMTKLVLLRVCDNVHLIEMDSGWVKRSKVYLGRKRASKCTFKCARLDTMEPLEEGSTDLVWVQWTLQYLTDRHAVHALIALSSGLTSNGMMIVKENRPYGGQRENRFHMETPKGEQGRYDITRSKMHHEVLFLQAGLHIMKVEEGEETHTYALARRPSERS